MDWPEHIPFIGWYDDHAPNNPGWQPIDSSKCRRDKPCIIIATRGAYSHEKVRAALGYAANSNFGESDDPLCNVYMPKTKKRAFNLLYKDESDAEEEGDTSAESDPEESDAEEIDLK